MSSATDVKFTAVHRAHVRTVLKWSDDEVTAWEKKLTILIRSAQAQAEVLKHLPDQKTLDRQNKRLGTSALPRSRPYLSDNPQLSPRNLYVWSELFQVWEDAGRKVGMSEGIDHVGPLERFFGVVHDAAGLEAPDHSTLKNAARRWRRGTYLGTQTATERRVKVRARRAGS